jgi:D-alanine-D-alanine ligase
MNKASSNGFVKRKRVAILFGGRSVEHEISVITGLQAIKAIDVVEYEPIPVYIAPSGKWYSGSLLTNQSFYKNMPDSLNDVDEVVLLPVPGIGGLTVLKRARKNGQGFQEEEEMIIPIDFYFPCFHGTYGEDGCLQGLLELAEVPYSGCGVLASALSMSKQHCKEVVSCSGVPVLPAIVVRKEKVQSELGKGLRTLREAILKTPNFEKFPLFVKPCTLGSSIGIARVTDVAELDAALLQALKYDAQAMVEPCIDNKLEINVAILDGTEPVASVTEIPVPKAGKELTYEDKYLTGGGKKSGSIAQGMAALTRIIDPPDLSTDIKTSVIDYAKTAFKSLGCSGAARLDFLLDLTNEKVYFNEINPLPGSLSFYLWAGLTPPILFTELITRMITRGERAFQEKTLLTRNVGFRALVKQA